MDLSSAERDINTPVSDCHLERISRCCCKDWKMLPAYLKLDATVAEDIDRKPVDEREKRHDFLRKWRKKKGSAATYKQLHTALLEIDCGEEAEKVYTILEDGPHPSILDAASLASLPASQQDEPPPTTGVVIICSHRRMGIIHR